jgi:hypothetical protein
MEQDKMTQRSRRGVLIKAVQDAAIELATRANHALYAPMQLDNKKPTAEGWRQ